MSYCHFSSMNWRCDVYVHQDISGDWITHIAGRRHLLPPVPDIITSRISMWLHSWSGYTWDMKKRAFVCPHRWRATIYKKWLRFTTFWHNRVHMGSLHLIPLRPIGLPHDGKTFNDSTADECADRLEKLRWIGYIVPQYAIDALRSEIIEDQT